MRAGKFFAVAQNPHVVHGRQGLACDVVGSTKATRGGLVPLQGPGRRARWPASPRRPESERARPQRDHVGLPTHGVDRIEATGDNRVGPERFEVRVGGFNGKISQCFSCQLCMRFQVSMSIGAG